MRGYPRLMCRGRRPAVLLRRGLGLGLGDGEHTPLRSFLGGELQVGDRLLVVAHDAVRYALAALRPLLVALLVASWLGGLFEAVAVEGGRMGAVRGLLWTYLDLADLAVPAPGAGLPRSLRLVVRHPLDWCISLTQRV